MNKYIHIYIYIFFSFVLPSFFDSLTQMAVGCDSAREAHRVSDLTDPLGCTLQSCCMPPVHQSFRNLALANIDAKKCTPTCMSKRKRSMTDFETEDTHHA